MEEEGTADAPAAADWPCCPGEEDTLLPTLVVSSPADVSTARDVPSSASASTSEVVVDLEEPFQDTLTKDVTESDGIDAGPSSTASLAESGEVRRASSSLVAETTKQRNKSRTLRPSESDDASEMRWETSIISRTSSPKNRMRSLGGIQRMSSSPQHSSRETTVESTSVPQDLGARYMELQRKIDDVATLTVTASTKEASYSGEDLDEESLTVSRTVPTENETVSSQEGHAEPGAYYVSTISHPASSIPGELLFREEAVLQQLGLPARSMQSTPSSSGDADEEAAEPYLTQAMLVEEDDPPELVVEAKPLRPNRRIIFSVLVATVVGFAAAGGLIAGLKARDERSWQASLTDSPTDRPTQSPTLAPTSRLDAELRSLLPTKTLVALEDDDSPQSRAYDWFTEVDGVFRQVSDVETNANLRCDRMKQRFALATLYFAAGGPSWNNQVFWLNESVNECSWYGCYCTLGLNGTLRGVDLSGNGLQGSVPPEIGLLGSTLDYFGLADNSLMGSIPTEIGHLEGLAELYLQSNMFTHVIPVELGSLVEMEHLELQENAFKGALPGTIGQMTRLSTLLINDNFLVESIPPQLGALVSLVDFSATRNHFGGTIPPSIGNMTSLRLLEIAENALSGRLPSEMGKLTELRVLNVTQNKLEGGLPSELGRLQELTQLSLSLNSYGGTIPTRLGLLSNLASLSISQCSLTGTIPAEIGQLRFLQTLQLQVNQLNSTIPESLDMLSRLELMDFSSNQLTGKVPPTFGNLSSLSHLDLSTNLLSSAIPPELGSLAALRYLDLSTNSLTGSVPTTVGLLLDLHDLMLAFNLSPLFIPSEIGLLRNLEKLVLAGNYNPIPSSISKLGNLRYLRIGSATLSGSILGTFTTFERLEVLSLTDCQLTGTIPTELAMLHRLLELNLGNNALSGPIPTELGLLKGLTFLDLSYNRLNGTIPSQLASLRDLHNDYPAMLESNNLEGSIPAALCDRMKELQVTWSVDCDEVDCADCGCGCPVVYDADDVQRKRFLALSVGRLGRTKKHPTIGPEHRSHQFDLTIRTMPDNGFKRVS